MAVARVRAATPADAPALAAVQRATWQLAYHRMLPATALDELSTPRLEHAWTETIDGGATVLVATEGDTVVGFIVAGAAPAQEAAAADGTPPPDAATTVLVSTLLVEPRWGRRGHGGRLLATAAQLLRGAGATRGITWVAAQDTASLTFYRRAGWAPDGTVRTLDAHRHPLRELRLSGPLDLVLT
jgi:GNAT superfamily N-acetyltransferase